MNIRHPDIDSKFYALLEKHSKTTIDEMPQERFDKFVDRFYEEFDDELGVLINKITIEIVERENYNHGNLKVGMIVKYQGEPHTVDLVNGSRARVSNMRNFIETDISVRAEVPIIQDVL
jgi:hypothetical protein